MSPDIPARATWNLPVDIKAGQTVAHSVSLAKGLGPTDPVEMEGQTVAMVAAYPDAVGMVNALNLELGDKFQIQYFSNTAFIIYVTGAQGWTSYGFAYIRAFPPTIPYPRYFGPYTANC